MIKDKQERPETAAPAIQLKNISKSFGPVQANKNISLTVNSGTIHGIVGRMERENLR